MQLSDMGWNLSRENAFLEYRNDNLLPARVTRVERGAYRILCPEGEWLAEVSGRFLTSARSRAEFPAVGDWVASLPLQGGERALIHAVLPRTGEFKRKVAGHAAEEQVVATNIDVAFLVTGLDRDFNVHRIERYLTLTYESGAVPVILLNKGDLHDDASDLVQQVEAVAFGVAVHKISAHEDEGVALLESHLAPGKTGAFLGSSGAGKSSLINALLGEDRLPTGHLRQKDGRGRHTTTWRELIQLPNNAWVIDTPGMRELHLLASEDSLNASFQDVDDLARNCKFRDCAHGSEPGCAVRSAIESGALPAERYESFLKLKRELRYLAGQQDARVRLEEKARWKAIRKQLKKHPKKRA